MTAKYPDILALMPELLSPLEIDDEGNEKGVRSFTIEPHTKALLTFQTLANRARKDVDINDVKVKVGIFAFDLMYLNGQVRVEEM
jgi:DNA ligase-1